MTNWNYVEDTTRPEIKTGVQRCVIVDAQEAVSKASGNPMIVVTVKPSGSNAKIKEYFVKGSPSFNRKLTDFFNAFPQIPKGNFDLFTWVGSLGAANFGTDENGYLKVKWWVSPDKAANLPEFVGDKPIKQDLASITDENDADGELPFEL